MKTIQTALAVAVLVTTSLLSACGDSSRVPGSVTTSTVPAGATATAAAVPATSSGAVPVTPASGSRAGLVYDIGLIAPGTGDTVGITVFEPLTLEAGKTYPLVLHSHGFGSMRQKTATADPVSSLASPGDIDSLRQAGYGAISISERGSDDSSGTIRAMDPDYEGKDLIAVLDWAEANLKWLAYGPSVDGSDAHNLIVGSIGGSYGGMYQYLINNIDPKHRLDAMATQIAPNDVAYMLFPNKTIKAGWATALFGIGNSAGENLDRGHLDPYIENFFVNAFATNAVSQDATQYLYYHSNSYFCNGVPVTANGPGEKPEHPPVPTGKINAIIFQGFRDTLANFNNAYDSYQCLRRGGGDVRLLSYQFGHNSLLIVPDPGNALYQPAGNALDKRCAGADVDTATVAFFDEYLKGIKGAANKVLPTKPCLSLTAGDSVLVDTVTTGKSGKMVAIPSTTVVAGSAPDVPVSVPLGITAGAAGDVIGGIPRLEVDVEKVNAAVPGEPIVFVGIGQTRNGVPGVYDLVDNQITPLRGMGKFSVDLVGVAERLAPGDTLALLIYGEHDQYHVTGSVNAGSPAVVPVTITGTVWVPLLGDLPNAAP